MLDELREYIRDEKRNPSGVLVGNPIGIGYSKVNVKKGDRFDREFGITKARDRANSGRIPVGHTCLRSEVPDVVHEQLTRFSKRCEKFFNLHR